MAAGGRRRQGQGWWGGSGIQTMEGRTGMGLSMGMGMGMASVGGMAWHSSQVVKGIEMDEKR